MEYFKRLNVFLAQCDYCVGKWECLDIVDKGVNNETLILLGYWDFHSKTIEDACYLLKWIAWNSFEFDKASRVSRYSFPDPCVFSSRSYYAPFWCDFCNSSNYDINSCPYYACYATQFYITLGQY